MIPTINNTDLVVASIAILIVVFLTTKERYGNISNSNKAFYRFMYVLLAGCITELLLNICLSYKVSSVMCNLLWLSFEILKVFLVSAEYLYVRSYDENGDIKKGYTVSDKVVLASIALVVLLSIVNMFTGITVFVTESGEIKRGPLAYAGLICFLSIIITTMLWTGTNKKFFTGRRFGAVFAMNILIVLSVAAEILVNSKVLISMFGFTLSTVIMLFSLETQDQSILKRVREENEKLGTLLKQADEKTELLKIEAEEAKINLAAVNAEMQMVKESALRAEKRADESIELANKASSAKTEFLARISHEIRNPLNVIVGMNEMIKMESGEKRITEYAEDISDASGKLLAIVNDLLDFSNMSSGKLKLLDDEYSFKNLMRELHALYSFKAKEKNLKLVFETDTQIPAYMIGDDVRIRQILANLLNNAIKYTDSGSVTLKATLEGKGRASALIKFAVIDTGCGIKEEDIGKMYEAFTKIAESSENNSEGSGLGISIASNLLTMMGSKLMIDSVYGLGSQFYFSIRQGIKNQTPVGDVFAEEKEESEENEKPLIKAPKAKVLVVDDNSLNIKVFTGLLKDTEIEITKALSGQEALGYTTKTKFDIIFMDHMMPKMDGVVAMERIKAQEDGLNLDTVIIALVANAIKGAYEEYIKYGFNDVVFKPSTQKELNEVLWKYIPGELIEM